VRSPGGVPSRRSARQQVSCCHAARSRPSTSGLCSAEESVAHPQSCPRGRLDAPMGFGSNAFRCLPRMSPLSRSQRRPGRAARCRPAVQHRASVLRCRGQRGRQEFSACLAPKIPMPVTDPKIGRLPVRLACSPKTAALPVRPARSRRSGRRSVARDLRPRRAEGSHAGNTRRSCCVDEATRGSLHRAGPFHPKVLGLQLP